MNPIDKMFCERYGHSPRPPQGYITRSLEANYMYYRHGWQDAMEEAARRMEESEQEAGERKRTR
jgi:hypothetical protein